MEYIGFDEESVWDCMKSVAGKICKREAACTSRTLLKTIEKKYQHKRYQSVSTLLKPLDPTWMTYIVCVDEKETLPKYCSSHSQSYDDQSHMCCSKTLNNNIADSFREKIMALTNIDLQQSLLTRQDEDDTDEQSIDNDCPFQNQKDPHDKVTVHPSIDQDNDNKDEHDNDSCVSIKLSFKRYILSSTCSINARVKVHTPILDTSM